VLAVVEVELLLAALLGWAGDHIALLRCVAQDGSAELFVHQDAGPVGGNSSGDRRQKAVVDDPFGGGDLCPRFARQTSLPAEHLRLEGAAMVEGKDVQRLIKSKGHRFVSFSLR